MKVKKQDLKNGMILETRNNHRYLLTDGVMRNINEFNTLEDYSEDLITMGIKEYDIVKIYQNNGLYALNRIFKDEHLILLWKREEIKLTDREIEMLKALKVLGYVWLARDKNYDLYTFINEPAKQYNATWFDDDDDNHFFPIKENDLFNFIKWEDKEPTKIDDLLKGE